MVEKADGAKYCDERCPSCGRAVVEIVKSLDYIGGVVWSLWCPLCFYRRVEGG
jgi:C4-type Zn-finger protein